VRASERALAIFGAAGGAAEIGRPQTSTLDVGGDARHDTRFGRKPVLDPSQRRRIAERYSAGETMAELAKDSDVS